MMGRRGRDQGKLFYEFRLENSTPAEPPHRLGRFREGEVLRPILGRVVWSAMAIGLVKGEGFAVDASVLEANASRYHGTAPEELDWNEKQAQRRGGAAGLCAAGEGAAPRRASTAGT